MQETELRARRKQLGLSTTKLASFLGIGLSSYGHFDTGDRPVSRKYKNKINKFKKLSNEEVLLGIYYGKSLEQVYRESVEQELEL